MSSVQFFRWVVVFTMLISLACSDSVQHFSKSTKEVEPGSIIRTMLADSASVDGTLVNIASIKGFYEPRNYRLIWTNGLSFTPQGSSLISIMQELPYWGLLPEDYHASQLSDLIHSVNTSHDALHIAKLEMLMTNAFYAIGSHVRYGRFKKDSVYHFRISPEVDTFLIDILTQAVKQNKLKETLETIEPSFSAYKVLKRDLKRKLDSLSLIPVDSIHQVASMEEKILQIGLTMEQWRWETGNLSKHYIRVNIPSYKLEVVKDDSVVFESNVVVGTPETPTPTLDALIRCFILYPNWNVPRKIATTELLPKLKSDTTYLKTHNYRVLDWKGNRLHPDSIKWSKYNTDNFPFMLQQSEGEHNALGIIKFVFNSEYDIYLHDTNAKRFFKKSQRALSHGCIRVEKALELANYLVSDSNIYCTPKYLERYLSTAQQRQVHMNPIDLHIRYYTCEARNDGTVQFHPDVYNRNKELKEAIYCRN